MSTHSPASVPVVSTPRTSRRRRLFLLVTSMAIAIAVLACPLTQDALSKTPAKSSASAFRLSPGILGGTVLAHSIETRFAHADTGFWHAEGSRILTAAGTPVRISGVNWSGFETTNMVPGGLTVQDYRTILRSIHAAGYNTIRIPFSNQMVESPIVPSGIRFEDASGKAINQDLADLDSLQILDRIVAAAGQLGLKVILDNHRSEAGSSAQPSGLWYTDQYPESAWIADWSTLAARYKGNTTVIGFDLRNEPHNATQGGACWSCGGANDWHLAAQRAGNAVLRINPSLLVFVEGTDTAGSESDFWGGNLAGVRTAPVRLSIPGRLVYSVHVYGPTEYRQSWFNAATTPASLAALYHRHWGFISESGIAPVWIGEFGTPNTDADVSSTEPGSEGQWFQALIAYLGAHPSIGWSYWGINGEDRYGLLDAAYSTTPANALKAQALAGIRLPRANSIETAATAPENQPAYAAPINRQPAFHTSPATYAPKTPSVVALHTQNRTLATRAQPTLDRAVEGSVAESIRLATTRALHTLPSQAE